MWWQISLAALLVVYALYRAIKAIVRIWRGNAGCDKCGCGGTCGVAPHAEKKKKRFSR